MNMIYTLTIWLYLTYITYCWWVLTQDVKNNVPSYWEQGLLEDHGNRYAGQSLTTDDMICDGAPVRIVLGKPVLPGGAVAEAVTDDRAGSIGEFDISSEL